MKLFHHVCIQTDRYEESLDFYQRILGFKVRKETKNFHQWAYNTWLEYDNFMIELQTNKENEVLRDYSASNKGLVHFCLLVDDIYAEYERLKALGFKNFKRKNGEDIYTVEGGKLLKIIAPEGTIIELRDTYDI